MGPGIDKDGFDRQIEITYQKLEGLLQRMSSSGEEASIASEAIEELSTTLEELHVASEELSRQNTQLVAAQLAAQAERQRYQDLFDFAPDGYLVTDTNGVIREVNRAAADLLHVAQERLVGKPLAVYVAEAERKAFRDILSTLLKRAITGANEWEIGLKPRTGKELRASITVTPVVPISTTQQTTGNEATDGVGLRWSLRDITESKRAEERERLLEESQRAMQEALQAKAALQESEERYRALVENSPDLITRFDREMRMVFANPATLLRTGRPVDALMGHTAQEYGAAQASASIWESNFRKVIETGKTQRFDNTNIWQGQVRIYDILAVPEFGADGTVAMVMVIARDITEKRQVEEHLAFQANILANIADVVYATDGQLQITYWNPAAEQLYGWKANEVLGKNVIEVVDSHFDRERRAKLSQELTEKGVVVAEVEHRTKSGQTAFFESKTILLRNKQGEISSYISVNHDITERKQVEEALRKNEADLRGILDATKESIWMFDPEGSILMGNQTALERLNRSAEEVIGQPFNKLVPAELAQARLACLRKVVESGQPVELEDERAGIIFHHIFYPVKDGAGSVVRIVAFSQDITERKRAELALRESEDKYRTLVKFAPAGIYEVDFRTGRFTEVNDVMSQILGYTRDELLNMTAFNILDDEGTALFAARIRLAQSGDQPAPATEYRVRTKDGRLIWALLNVTFHREGGKIVGATVIANDITERKQAEEQIQSLARFPSENPNPVLRASYEGVLLYANESSQPLLSEWQATIGQPLPEFWHKIIAEAPTEKKQADINIGERVFSFIVSPVPEAGYINLYGREVTERKQMEDALRESQTLLRAVMVNTPDPVYVKDMQGRILMCNPALEQVAGKPAADIIGRTDSEYYEDDVIGQALRENDLRVMESGRSQTMEETIRKPQGYRVFLSSKAPYRNESGDIIGIVGISHDITERKQAEEKLQASNDELRRFNKAMVGRELRMVELKNEINELCRQAGLPERYKKDNQPETTDSKGIA